MIIRRLVVVCAVLVASLGLVAVPGVQAADDEGRASGGRGKIPLPDVVAGNRRFEVTTAKVSPGGNLKFTASGFVRDEGGGQTLIFKLNDIDILGSGVEADASGNASGSIKLPDAAVFKEYKRKYGSDQWWVRVLVGSGRPDGEPDLPASSLHDGFTLTGLSSGATRAVGGSVNAKGTHLALTLKPGTAKKTKLQVESLSPVPIGSRPRMITVAKGQVKPKKKAALKLTNDGKRYFRRYDALYVAAVSKAHGSKAATKIFKIKKK